MTSAQNHRLRLNGNKIIGFILVALLSLNSCSIFKKSRQTNPDIIVIEDDKGKIATIGKEAEKDSLGTLSDLPPDTVASQDRPGMKERYKIAVILPFNTSEIIQYANSEDDEEYFTSEYSIEKLDEDATSSLEFYEGALYALEQLSRDGLKVDLHVYDSNKSDFSINNILSKYEMGTMDLIVGPVYNSPSRTVAQYAKEHQIYHILPFSPSSSIAEDNPYHIKINPTIGVHCRNMFDYITKNYRNANVVVFHRAKANELMIDNMFVEMENEYNAGANSAGDPFSMQHVLITEDDDEIDPYLSSEKENIVIVASFSEAFAQKITRKLHFKTKDHRVTVFGMPTWMKSKSLRLDYFESLNVHLTQNFWVDESNRDAIDFIDYFEDNYYTYPSEAAFIGYDIMHYFGQMLNLHGLNFFDEIVKGKTAVLHTSFMFGSNEAKPTSAADQPAVNFFENKYVHLFKYENYELHKMN